VLHQEPSPTTNKKGQWPIDGDIFYSSNLFNKKVWIKLIDSWLIVVKSSDIINIMFDLFYYRYSPPVHECKNIYDL
jgi:hypothetical protein